MDMDDSGEITDGVGIHRVAGIVGSLACQTVIVHNHFIYFTILGADDPDGIFLLLPHSFQDGGVVTVEYPSAPALRAVICR